MKKAITDRKTDRRVFNPLTGKTLFEVVPKLDTIEKIVKMEEGYEVSDVGYLTEVMKH